MSVPIYVLTNDKHLWLLRGFCYFMGRFWRPATVVGFNPPDWALPDGFDFVSLGGENWPVERWSDSLLALCAVAEERFVLMLEDYWLTGPAADTFVDLCAAELAQQGRTLRIDLSNDRFSRRQARFVGPTSCFVETPSGTPYQMSFQAAVWDRDLLAEVLEPGWTPWQAEIEGSKKLARQGKPRVLGTSVWPVRYKPVYRAGKNRLTLDGLPAEHVARLKRRGWLQR